MPVAPPRERIFLLLGSNLGKPEQHLNSASEAIARFAGSILRQSSIYRSAPWGKTDQPWFLNQAVELSSELEPLPLLHKLQQIEVEIGRENEVRWGPRKIDIDIIFYGNRVIASSDLKVPHPRLADRKFVLVPLSEIAPDFIDPLRHERINAILSECKDTLSVERL